MNNERPYIRTTRRAVQAGFLAMTAWICYRLYVFLFQFDALGNVAGKFAERPTGVDAFLPIGGFMSLKYFLFTLGIVEPSHPAAMVFFVAVAVSAMFVKKGFCGWICPVGAISEYVSLLGQKIFGRNLAMPGKADLGLMSVKYLLMGAFVFLVLVMPPSYMVLFFMQEEFKLMDGRMLLFFMDPSSVTLIVLGALLVLTLLYRSFWCRYLCPYGALLGMLSWLSPFKVRRFEDKCIHCKACSRICPMQIDVEKEDAVTSAECFGCMSCISKCPSEGALEMTFKPGKAMHVLKRPLVFAVALLGVFYLVVVAGALAGLYKSRLPMDEYRNAVPFIMKNRRSLPKTQPSSQPPPSSSGGSTGSSLGQPVSHCPEPRHSSSSSSSS